MNEKRGVMVKKKVALFRARGIYMVTNMHDDRETEPYYWEQVYKLCDSGDVIPVDENGQAHIFSLVQENTEPREQLGTQHEPVQHEDTASDSSPLKHKSTSSTAAQWCCHSQLCNIHADTIHSTDQQISFCRK